MRVALLEGNSSVGSASRETLAVRVGLGDRLELARATLRQVPFLVLEDQQLEKPHPLGLSHRGHYATGFRLLSEDDAPLSVSAQEPLVVAAADKPPVPTPLRALNL